MKWQHYLSAINGTYSNRHQHSQIRKVSVEALSTFQQNICLERGNGVKCWGSLSAQYISSNWTNVWHTYYLLYMREFPMIQRGKPEYHFDTCNTRDRTGNFRYANLPVDYFAKQDHLAERWAFYTSTIFVYYTVRTHMNERNDFFVCVTIPDTVGNITN